MVRGLPIASLVCGLAGCSFVLDFSDKAIPKDAMLDGPYTADECAFGEPNDTVATPFTVMTTDVGPAAICPTPDGSDDHDFYKFTVPAMTASFNVTVTLMNRAGGDLDLRLYDATGNMIGQSRGFGDEESVTCPGTSPPCTASGAGDYIFEVFPAQPGFVNDYQFSIKLN